jgi:hypothetical protein
VRRERVNHRHTPTARRAAIPETVVMISTRNPRAVWARHVLTRRALVSVAAALAKRGIPVLAVKGVVTSGWLYRDPSERPLTDLDIRVRPRDFTAVVRACASEGWQLERRLWSYRTLMIGVDEITVDVESHVGPPGATSLPVDRLFDRASLDPEGFWIPEPHDHALLLTINVFKDKISAALPWAVEDAARVVDTPGFVPRTYVDRAREARLAAMAWVVADWMARERRHVTWTSIRSLLGGDVPARARYTTRVRRLFSSGDPASLEARLLARAASDDPRQWPKALALAAACEFELHWHNRQLRPR